MNEFTVHVRLTPHLPPHPQPTAEPYYGLFEDLTLDVEGWNSKLSPYCTNFNPFTSSSPPPTGMVYDEISSFTFDQAMLSDNM